MVVQQDAVRQHGIALQEALRGRPLHRCRVVATDHLADFDHGLADMGRKAAARRVGVPAALGEQFGGHRVDLGRKDHGVEPARVVRFGISHDPLGFFELGQTAGLVPFPCHRLRRSHAPPGRGEGRRRVKAHAALCHRLEPAVEGERDVAGRGRAGAQHFRVGERRGALPPVVPQAKGLEALHQTCHLLLGDAMVLADAAIARLGTWMAVDVHQTGKRQHASPVQCRLVFPLRSHPCRRDLADAPVLQEQVDVAAIDVAAARAIQHDGPRDIPDRRRPRCHSLFSPRHACCIGCVTKR